MYTWRKPIQRKDRRYEGYSRREEELREECAQSSIDYPQDCTPQYTKIKISYTVEREILIPATKYGRR